VKKSVDCQVFGDQLDSLARGELPEEGRRQLLLHAEECPDCAMQLKVQEHLLGPTLRELEEAVPEALLHTVWPKVREGMGFRDGTSSPRAIRGPGVGRRSFQRWVVPTLAAASVALLFSTGFLIRETRRLSEEGALLAQQVVEQERWMAELGSLSAADPVKRTAALAGRSPFARALSRQETISIGGLQSLLERMPGDRRVLSRAQLDAVLRNRIGLSQPLLREALAGIEARDGVRARELIRALEDMDVGPGFTLPTADLVEILS
jgi:hypothetical protein